MASKESKSKKHPTEPWDIYLSAVLKMVQPDITFSAVSKRTMNALVNNTLQSIMESSNNLVRSTPKVQTLSSRNITAAIRLSLPGELAKHAVNEASKALNKYNSAGKTSQRTSRSQKAGLIFSVSRVENKMTRLSVLKRKSEGAAVMVTAALEYLAAEVLELAGNSTRDSKRTRMSNRDILNAVNGDEELSALYKSTVLPGGVEQHIHFSYIPKKGEKKSKKKSKK